jgi:hypothetical protein
VGALSVDGAQHLGADHATREQAEANHQEGDVAQLAQRAPEAERHGEASEQEHGRRLLALGVVSADERADEASAGPVQRDEHLRDEQHVRAVGGEAREGQRHQCRPAPALAEGLLQHPFVRLAAAGRPAGHLERRLRRAHREASRSIAKQSTLRQPVASKRCSSVAV